MPNKFLGLAEGSLLNVTTGLVTIKDAKPTTLICLENKLRAIKEKHISTNTLQTLTLQNGLTIGLAKDQKVLVLTTKGKTWLRAIELHQQHNVVVSLGGSFSQDYYQVFDQNKNPHVFDENMARFLAIKKHCTVDFCLKKTPQYYKYLLLAFPDINLVRNPDDLLDFVANEFGYSINTVPAALFLSPESVVRAYLQECFSDNCYAPATAEDSAAIRSLLLKLKIIGSRKNNLIVLTQYEHNTLHSIKTIILASEVTAYTIPHNLSQSRPMYINSELNNYLVSYKLEVELAKDLIDKDFAYCQVKSLFCDGYKKESYQLMVDDFAPFSANGFVLSSNL